MGYSEKYMVLEWGVHPWLYRKFGSNKQMDVTGETRANSRLYLFLGFVLWSGSVAFKKGVAVRLVMIWVHV